MILLFLLWPFAEIYAFILVVERFGFFNAFMATLTGFLVGLLIVKSLGQSLFAKVQAELTQGKVPARSILNGALLFIGGLLIMVPGFISDFFGILLILPGTRHLFSYYVQWYLARKISNGSFKVFTSGFGTGGGFQGFGQRPGQSGERDVTPQVIDVKPISSTEERE